MQSVINEFVENKYFSKLNKKKVKMSTKEEKNKTENAPNLSQIPKEVMRSTINEIKMKIDALNNNNNNDDGDKNKLKFIKLKYKKSLNKNLNLNLGNNGNNEGLKYFNSLNMKKDKVELHDHLVRNKSSKKIKKDEQTRKVYTDKNNESSEEIIKLKKLSVMLDLRKKSKKKLIDYSPDRRVHRCSNFTNYKTSDIANIKNPIAYETNKSLLIKKNKKVKE